MNGEREQQNQTTDLLKGDTVAIVSDVRGRPFDNSGFAALSDFRSSEWQALFRFLENQQETFLEKEPFFRIGHYKGPRDPLHNWSRAWEYPYVLHHLRKWHNSLSPDSEPLVVDLGSGVTFFPFVVAEEGCRVVPLDIDPVCEQEFARAGEHIRPDKGSVAFRLVGGSRLPLSDSEADCVYCVSVMEHVPRPTEFLQEVIRILKPGGLFLLTMDVALDNTNRLQADEFDEVIGFLGRFFLWHEPQRPVHPSTLLTSRTSPFASAVASPPLFGQQLRFLMDRLTGRDPKPLTLGGVARSLWHHCLRTFGLTRQPPPMHLTCFAASLLRKATGKFVP